MNLRPHRKQEVHLDITPLIDVVFLLLIFFMVSTTFDKFGAIKIDLPEGSTSSEKPDQRKQLEVSIDAQGNIFVGEEQVLNPELKILMEKLGAAAGEARDLPVIISADGRSPHQAVVRVMDAASQLGFTRMSFPTTAPAATR